MPLSKLWLLAYRDLGRNRRRSILTLAAVALGLALLMVMNGFIAGVMDDSLQNSIRLRTGHVQIHAASYEEDQPSLQSKDLLADPEALLARASALPEVRAAAPVVWASGILATIDDSAGLRIYGVDPASPIYAPIRAALVQGEFLAPDDRGGILIGKALADSMGIGVGQRTSLAIVNADGQPDQGTFIIRGLFTTGIPSYDESTALMPLARAQTFTGVGRRASAIFILLHSQDDAEQAAAALRGPNLAVPTWAELNQLFVQAFQTSMSFYLILDFIVILIVAVIIANTLLMAVFERIREMGILAALGMKGRSILQMLLLEGASLALAGIAAGLALGSAGVAYLATAGIPISDRMAAVGGSGIALSTTMYARFVPGTFAGLALAMLVIVLLASLYPAWYAARLQPAEALRARV